MAHYHLYFLRDSELVGSEHIEAEDDQEAVRIARALVIMAPRWCACNAGRKLRDALARTVRSLHGP